MDTHDPFTPNYPAPTALRPMLGLTVLVIEDSRYACDAMRLLCLRSGARIRCVRPDGICKFTAPALPSSISACPTAAARI